MLVVMKKCWAEKLGECSGDISREHLVSSSLFSHDIVNVQGLGWCRNEVKRIGLANLTSKILCKKHNNDLSEVDMAGAESFDILREVKRQFFVRQKLLPRRWTVTRYYIDGTMLERWFLKTGLNLVYYDQSQLKDSDQSPDVKLLEVIYGKQKLKEFAGLYITFSTGQRFSSIDDIEFNVLSNNDGNITGYRFAFQGFRFWVSLITKKLVKINYHQSDEPTDDWSNSQLIYHPSKIRIKEGKYVSQIIYFKWQ